MTQVAPVCKWRDVIIRGIERRRMYLDVTLPPIGYAAKSDSTNEA
jgi:hypothetical protein